MEASQLSNSEPHDAPVEQADEANPSTVEDVAVDEATEADDQPAPSVPKLRPATRIIALMNQKGGVGKTTTSANLGAALAEAGYRVLMIDLDPQAHLTLHLGVNPDELDVSVYDVLTNENVSAMEVALEISNNLVVLPAEVNLAGAETELAIQAEHGQPQQILRKQCQALLGHGYDQLHERLPEAPAHNPNINFDYVLIDCPPSLGMLTMNALAMAQEVFVPMQAHFLALQGLSKLLETVRLVQDAVNPDLRVSGVVLCMHEAQTILAGEVVADLEGFFDEARGTDAPWADANVLSPPIRRNIKLAESPSFGKTIFDYEPNCPGAQDYRALAKTVTRM
jgi:chromosome partitioning protein